ncbi:N-acetyltransferase [Zoogloea sp. LCSB751]|uniref:GNAT family N-acetyltransferase n=1 Tax=Zoogloea sp. LCSB751 TaxID=1965277 RepID=UPI0009A503A3|nr:GNAT family N-acetyltransferase [Zoogloea sp. LCSB751]
MLSEAGYGYLPITEVNPTTLERFSCGKPRLDEFLATQALALHEARLGFTNVVFHQQFEGPVGYFTLANDAIKLNTSEKFDLGVDEHVELAAFPAVKIGRLAVHQDLQRTGVGAALMALLLGDILNTAGLSAARLIVVDADNDDAVLGFYKKLGFETSLWAEDMARNHTKKRVRPATIKMHRDVFKGL